MNSITVTRQRASTVTDGYGETIPSWTSPAELEIDGCAIAPVTEGENNEFGRLGVPIGWQLFRRSPADIRALDRIVTPDGRIFEVDGDPARWDSLYGTFAGIVVALTRMEG